MGGHGHSETRILRSIAGNLLAQGLEVTEAVPADRLAELAIANPAALTRGRIYVGNEGYEGSA
jgi:hypothetical protein